VKRTAIEIQPLQTVARSRPYSSSDLIALFGWLTERFALMVTSKIYKMIDYVMYAPTATEQKDVAAVCFLCTIDCQSVSR